MEQAIASPDWEGRNHVYIEHYGLPSYVIDFKLRIKSHQNKIAKEMREIQAELGIVLDEEDDDE